MFVVTVDLPTPPLPDETAITRPRFGYATGVGAAGVRGAGAASMTGSAPRGFGAAGAEGAATDGGASAESRTSTRTSVTPSTFSRACRTCRASVGSSCAARRSVTRTLPSRVAAMSRTCCV